MGGEGAFMNLRILGYSEERQEEDLELFLKRGVYYPSYVDAVKTFVQEDFESLRESFPRRTYFFCHFFDELMRIPKGMMPQPNTADVKKIKQVALDDFQSVRADSSETQDYAALLSRMYQANRNGVEELVLRNGRTVLASVCRFHRTPLYTVWLAAGTWCEALGMSYGFSEAPLPILKGVFAASYLYIKSFEANSEQIKQRIGEWCSDNSAAESLFEGEDAYFFEYPAVKKALEVIGQYGTGGFYDDAGLNFKALFDFSVSVCENVDFSPSVETLEEAQARVDRQFGLRRTVMEDMCAQLANGMNEREVFERFEERSPLLKRQIKQWHDMAQVRDFVKVKLHDRAREAMFRTRGERQRGGS